LATSENNTRVVRSAEEDEDVKFYFKKPVSSYTIQFEVRSITNRTFFFVGIARPACLDGGLLIL